LQKVPRERLEEVARAVRKALPQCDAGVFYRRRLRAGFRFALVRGRFRAAFFFAFGRDAFFFFLAAGRGFGISRGSSRIGAGGVAGAGGYSGSIMPGPVQLLSEKSVGSSIA